ncbi:MAG: HEPN domain-containing protein [Nitrospirota bacterium]
MKEVESLISRASKYIKSAAMLIAEEDYESSVSRSYYAMFYCIEALLLTKGSAPDSLFLYIFSS